MPVWGVLEYLFTHLTNYCVSNWIDTNIYAVKIRYAEQNIANFLSPSIGRFTQIILFVNVCLLQKVEKIHTFTRSVVTQLSIQKY